jgi:hypothetical protein
MTFKPAIWRPVSIVLSALNVVAVGAAAGAAQPWHAGIHAALAVAFGLWAQRLGKDTGGGGDNLSRLDALEVEVGNLRAELNEAQERLDFTERVLAQTQEQRRLDPEH